MNIEIGMINKTHQIQKVPCCHKCPEYASPQRKKVDLSLSKAETLGKLQNGWLKGSRADFFGIGIKFPKFHCRDHCTILSLY